jgi:hypothetical protein
MMPEPSGKAPDPGAGRTQEKERQIEEAGERGENPEHVGIDQDPGERQKENQNRQKDDPLAA